MVEAAHVRPRLHRPLDQGVDVFVHRRQGGGQAAGLDRFVRESVMTLIGFGAKHLVERGPGDAQVVPGPAQVHAGVGMLDLGVDHVHPGAHAGLEVGAGPFQVLAETVHRFGGHVDQAHLFEHVVILLLHLEDGNVHLLAQGGLGGIAVRPFGGDGAARPAEVVEQLGDLGRAVGHVIIDDPGGFRGRGRHHAALLGEQ